MASKSTGTPRKSAKKSTSQPIPINSATTGAAGNGAVPEHTSAKQGHHGMEEEIRRRAYELYEQRGRHEGSHEEDWSRAEEEIRSKYQREKSA
ncbi:MAG: hypothetical protein DMG65_11960 [Candidatus Angelobacter sp. Gp1-AA117]|nr:MAG: hypothetical protein DMG65_11960 [Candidatus Angelobacter sp. Gp1-AA117]